MKYYWQRSLISLLLSVLCFLLAFALLDQNAEAASPPITHQGSRFQIMKFMPGVSSKRIRDVEAEPIVGKELYVSYIYEIRDLYFPSLDPKIVQAVMNAESNYDPTALSKCGAVGLMQVIPKYHAWRMEKYGLFDIWDPYTNIIVGMDFLNESYLRYGSYYAALRAYGGTDKYARYILSTIQYN